MSEVLDDRLNEIIAEFLDLRVDEITDDLESETAPTWDSLNHLKLVNAIEEEFDVKFSIQEVQAMDSVLKVRTLLKERIG